MKTEVIPPYEELAKRVRELESMVAERRLAEEALRESERRFRNMLENISLIGIMLDKNGDIDLCNDFLLNLTGWNREEVLRRNFFEIFLPPEIREKVLTSVFVRAIKEAEILSYYENEIVTRHGERRLIAWSNTVFHDNQGNALGVACIGEDITERKQAEENLKKLMDELEVIVEERTSELQRKNIALSEVLSLIDIEKHNLENKIKANIETLLLPIIEKLIKKSTSIDGRYLMLLKQNLLDLTSSHGAKLSSPAYNLTPKETELCALIKGGFTVKEIAVMQNLSTRTIETHRYNIRKKLGISASKSNLVSFLSSL